MAEDYKLIDNEEKHRYEFQIDGKIAEIDYIKSNNGEIYLVHTEVPASLGGKGVGSQLQQMLYIQFIGKNELFQCLLFFFIETARINYDCFFSVIP